MAEKRDEVAFSLNQARLLAEQDRFEEALEAVTNAYKYATAAEVTLVDETGRQIEERRRQRVRELTSELEELLALPVEELTDEWIRQGEELLAQLRFIHTDPIETDRLQERWREHRRRAHIERILQETRRELEELWGSHYVYLSRYDEALALARKRAGEYPEEAAFQELLRRAEQKRAEAYKASGELSTQAVTAGFKDLIEEVQRLYDRGEAELPWYEWGFVERDGQKVRAPIPQKLVPASNEPISHLVALAREYEDGKAEEYRQRAQAALPADPELAAEWVLPMLLPDTPVPPWVIERLSPDELKQRRERFTYCSEERRKAITAFYTQTIAPALKRRERARALLDKALEVGQDPENAWGLIAQAAVADPYLTDKVEEARETLRPQLRVRWNQALQKAEDARREGRFEDALATAERILEQIGDDKGLADVAQRAGQVRRDCQADRDLLSHVQDEARRLTALAEKQPAQAAHALAELEARVEGRPWRFQQPLQAPREAIRRRQSLEQKLAGWELRLRRTDPTGWGDEVFRDRTALQAKLDDLDRILEEMAGEGDDPRLTALKTRVIARQHALQGRAAWVAGLYDRARDHWLKARGQDDDALVQRWLQEAEDATRVSAALSQAQSLYKDGRYKEALDILSPWRTRASPRQNEVIGQYKTIGKKYAEELVRAIEGHIQSQKPLYRRLVELINELEGVAPEKADMYMHDHFPTIYEEWGDHARKREELSEALDCYDKALKYARGEALSRLARKRCQVRKDIAFNLVNAPGTEWTEKQRILEELRDEYPNDVETLGRLAEMALEHKELQQAKEYLNSLERLLNEAERRNDPTIAGLESAGAVAEWRLQLRGWKTWAQAIEDIARFFEETKGFLQPSQNIGEYRKARERRDALVKQLQERGGALVNEIQRRPQEFDQYPNATRVWKQVHDRLQQLINDVKRTYGQLEGDLMRNLEAVLKNRAPLDVETLDFRSAPPAPDVGERWQIGLKVFYLSDGRRAGDVYEKVLRCLSRLENTIRDLAGDVSGPKYALDGTPIQDPRTALERQILWAENAEAWARLVHGLLDAYGWAAGREEGRADARTAFEGIDEFQKALLNLRDAANRAERRLELAISVGKTGPQHWGLVNWRQLVKQIVQQVAPNKPWDDLEDTDRDRRWMAWGRAAEVLQKQHLAEQPEQAPWQTLDREIVASGPDERWGEVLEPLVEVRPRFGQHRIIEWLSQRHREARQTRNRLALTAIELYALVQAEEFQAALDAMARMEKLDHNDNYGFRARLAIPTFQEERKPLGWQALRQRLEDQQREWEQFLSDWAVVETSALTPWLTRERDSAITLVGQARYAEAIELCEDARDGKLPGGRTNRLGGGLALKPLQDHLQTMKTGYQNPRSYRVERRKSDIAQREHDAADAVRELDRWLLVRQEEKS